MPGADEQLIHSLLGVYNAEGTVRGEIAYLVAKLGGHARCSLCEITHKGMRRRGEFDEACGTLPVPVDLVHLDGRSEAAKAASQGQAPCVLARTDAGLVLLLGPTIFDFWIGSHRSMR